MKHLFILFTCFMLTACIYNQHTNEQRTGTSVSSQKVAMVESGKTTKQWILVNFGILASIVSDKDGFEVFEYVSERTKKTHKSFIFLFNIDSKEEIEDGVMRVVLRNDVVESIDLISEG
jgi:endo-1,4-beta-mannosidase